MNNLINPPEKNTPEDPTTEEEKEKKEEETKDKEEEDRRESIKTLADKMEDYFDYLYSDHILNFCKKIKRYIEYYRRMCTYITPNSGFIKNN